MKRLIDISHHNTINDMNGFKTAPIDGVIIRAFSGMNKDKKLEAHIQACKDAGYPYGFYIYSYALTPEKAVEEINNMFATLKELGEDKPPLMVAFDFEDADSYKSKKNYNIWSPDNTSKNSDICYSACHRIEELGCYAMLYASDTIFKSHLNDKVADFDKWVARWGNQEPSSSWGLWQYTDKCLMIGFSGNVDVSKTENDYEAIIKKMYERNGVKKSKANGSTAKKDDSKKNAETDLQVGDAVRLTTQTDYNGTRLARWVLDEVFQVFEIKGDRVVVGRFGSVTCAMHKNEVLKV